MDASLSNLLNAAAGVGLGVYVVMCAVNGNVLGVDSAGKTSYNSGDGLVPYIVNDADYIEFVVAMVAIWALLQWGPSKEIVMPLVVAGVIGLLLRAGASNQTLLAALSHIGQPGFWQYLQTSTGLGL